MHLMDRSKTTVTGNGSYTIGLSHTAALLIYKSLSDTELVASLKQKLAIKKRGELYCDSTWTFFACWNDRIIGTRRVNGWHANEILDSSFWWWVGYTPLQKLAGGHAAYTPPIQPCKFSIWNNGKHRPNFLCQEMKFLISGHGAQLAQVELARRQYEQTNKGTAGH